MFIRKSFSFRSFIVSALVCYALVGNGQVMSVEYFWDHDPGVGNGFHLQAIDGVFDEVLENIFINHATLPTPQGAHLLGLRVQDNCNQWGPTFSKLVVIADTSSIEIKIMAAEYFWDNDPGQGNGIALIAFDGNFNEAVEVIYNSNVTLPTPGLHQFNIRVKDAEHKWGPVFKKVIEVNDHVNNSRPLSVTAAEFFWDNDPGEGNGTALLAFDGNFNEALEQIAGSRTPGIGLHTFHIRARDENNEWGPVFTKVVEVNDQVNNPRLLGITAAEFFWDNDPGEGNGTALLAFDGNFNEALEQVSGSNTPATGLHTFNIRILDENNEWGPVFKKVVAINDQLNTPGLLSITAAEFFWNDDPGEGNGMALLAFDGNFDDAIEQIADNITPAAGMHTFNIRVRDEKNEWGPVFKKVVTVTNHPRPLHITQAEYYWDTDPGEGNGFPLFVIDGAFDEALETSLDANANNPYKGPHLLCARVRDELGHWGPVYRKVMNFATDYNHLEVSLNYGSTRICSDDSVLLIAGGAGSYGWYPSTGLSDSIGSAVFAHPSVNTTYMVIGQGDIGIYDTAYVTINVIPASEKQSIQLITGWNIISSYIEPTKPAMPEIFRDISSEIHIVKDDQGQIYTPFVGVNTIGDWLIKEGYQTKAKSPITLTIGCGIVDPQTPINLQAGWSLIGYLRTTPMAIDSALNTISSNIFLVKDNDGKTFVPSFGINDIGNMLPGQGYQIKMSSGTTLVYPAN